MDAVDDYLVGQTSERQGRVRHFMEVIEVAVPGLPCRLWEYGGGLFGYGIYRYRYASGREGSFFMVGIGNRKRYVAIYSNAAHGTRYLAETFSEQLPGCKIGRSCIEVPDSVTIADDVLAELTRQTVDYFRGEFARPKTPKSLQLWEGESPP